MFTIFVLRATQVNTRTPHINTRTFTIAGCKYVRNSQWSECAPGDTVKTKVMNLEPGQPTSCPATRTKTASCKARRRNKAARPKKSNNNTLF